MTFVLNPFVFGGVKELARDTSFFVGGGLATNPTDARNIGDASPTRRVFALISAAHLTQARTLNSATIGGVAATIHAQANSYATGATQLAAIVSTVVPTGTTAVVSATFTGTVQNFVCGVIALDGLENASPHDTLATFATDNATLSGTIDKPEAGYAMALAITTSAEEAPSCTWSGLSEYLDDLVDLGLATLPYSAAYQHPTSLEASAAIQATFADVGAGVDPALVALSWR